jgi:hypothetical protein
MNYMKSKLTILLFILFLTTWNLTINAQTSIPKGKAQLIEFTNATAKFTVPEGKTWYIQNTFSDWRIECTQPDGTTGRTIRVFLKSLNGLLKTDLSKNKFGPLLYFSSETNSMSLIFPEKTTFELLLVSSEINQDIKLFNGLGYINIIETDNLTNP